MPLLLWTTTPTRPTNNRKQPRFHLLAFAAVLLLGSILTAATAATATATETMPITAAGKWKLTEVWTAGNGDNGPEDRQPLPLTEDYFVTLTPRPSEPESKPTTRMDIFLKIANSMRSSLGVTDEENDHIHDSSEAQPQPIKVGFVMGTKMLPQKEEHLALENFFNVRLETMTSMEVAAVPGTANRASLTLSSEDGSGFVCGRDV